MRNQTSDMVVFILVELYVRCYIDRNIADRHIRGRALISDTADNTRLAAGLDINLNTLYDKVIRRHYITEQRICIELRLSLISDNNGIRNLLLVTVDGKRTVTGLPILALQVNISGQSCSAAILNNVCQLLCSLNLPICRYRLGYAAGPIAGTFSINNRNSLICTFIRNSFEKPRHIGSINTADFNIRRRRLNGSEKTVFAIEIGFQVTICFYFRSIRTIQGKFCGKICKRTLRIVDTRIRDSNLLGQRKSRIICILYHRGSCTCSNVLKIATLDNYTFRAIIEINSSNKQSRISLSRNINSYSRKNKVLQRSRLTFKYAVTFYLQVRDNMIITVNMCTFCNRLNYRAISQILSQCVQHIAFSSVHIIAGVISAEVKIIYKYGSLVTVRTLADSIKILYKIGIVLDQNLILHAQFDINRDIQNAITHCIIASLIRLLNN